MILRYILGILMVFLFSGMPTMGEERIDYRFAINSGENFSMNTHASSKKDLRLLAKLLFVIMCSKDKIDIVSGEEGLQTGWSFKKLSIGKVKQVHVSLKNVEGWRLAFTYSNEEQFIQGIEPQLRVLGEVGER